MIRPYVRCCQCCLPAYDRRLESFGVRPWTCLDRSPLESRESRPDCHVAGIFGFPHAHAHVHARVSYAHPVSPYAFVVPRRRSHVSTSSSGYHVSTSSSGYWFSVCVSASSSGDWFSINPGWTSGSSPHQATEYWFPNPTTSYEEGPSSGDSSSCRCRSR